MEQWEYVIMQVNRGDVSKQVERLCEGGQRAGNSSPSFRKRRGTSHRGAMEWALRRG